MKAVKLGPAAWWAAGIVGVTAALGTGLFVAWRQDLLTPNWWRYWERPELLYPEELEKPIHVRIPEELPPTPKPTATETPTPIRIGGVSVDLNAHRTSPTPIAPRPVSLPATATFTPSLTPTTEPTATPSFTLTPTPRPRLQPGTVFFWEDFSGVADGLLPEGWIGGEHLSVMTIANQKVLHPFERAQEYRIQTGPISFWPDDFRLEWVIAAGKDRRVIDGVFTVEVTNITAQFGRTWGPATFYINQSSHKIPDFEKTLVRITIEKQGPVVKGFVDGVQVLVLRVESFEIPRHIVFSVTHSSAFKLLQIGGIAL